MIQTKQSGFVKVFGVRVWFWYWLSVIENGNGTDKKKCITFACPDWQISIR